MPALAGLPDGLFSYQFWYNLKGRAMNILNWYDTIFWYFTNSFEMFLIQAE
jgi:hypothetical protein